MWGRHCARGAALHCVREAGTVYVEQALCMWGRHCARGVGTEHVVGHPICTWGRRCACGPGKIRL